MSTGKKKFKIIDFRVRPPLVPFKILYDLKLMRLTWENKFTVAVANTAAPSMYKVGQPEGLDLLKQEMDEAGVDYIVIPGRKIAAAPEGGVLTADNKKLYPLYETIIKHDVFLMHQSGIYAGPDVGVNDWAPLDRVMQTFPKLKVLLAHGGYPAVIDAISLVTKHPNFYISPDIYCHFPGGRIYVEAISMLPDQFIYASAYPLGPIKESVDGALQFPLSDDVMAKYMYGNAARLLKLG